MDTTEVMEKEKNKEKKNKKFPKPDWKKGLEKIKNVKLKKFSFSHRSIRVRLLMIFSMVIILVLCQIVLVDHIEVKAKINSLWLFLPVEGVLLRSRVPSDQNGWQ